MRVNRRTLLGGGLAMGLAGCAGVPTSGPVEQVSPAKATQAAAGIDIRPAAPANGAAPDVILAGFLDAMASLEPDHQVAREYLTAEAAQAWDPSTSVQVFDGDTRSVVVTGSSATLQADLVGGMDQHGHYTAAAGGQTLRQVFQMRRVAGQWRITNPPNGLLVSQLTMQHRFTPVTVWFFGENHTVVPEQVWLASTQSTPTLAVQALLQGPSSWLAPAVTSGIPVGTKIVGTSMAVSQGVATLALDDHATGLPEAQRQQVVQQLAFTLAPFDDVTSLRVQVDGQTWSLPGQDSSGAVSLATQRGATAWQQTASGRTAVVMGGRVGQLDDTGAFSALSGALGSQPWREGVSQVAVAGGTVAVDGRGDQLGMPTASGDSLQVVLKGNRLHSPQITPSQIVWVADGGDAATSLHRGALHTAPRVVPIPSLKGTQVVSFSVAPDESRLAVVLRRGRQTEVGLLLVHDAVVDSYRRLPLLTSGNELGGIIDVDWANPSQVVVLASATSQGQPSVWLVETDASQVTQLGPAGDVAPVALVTQPQMTGMAACILVRGQQVLRYDGPWRWPVTARDVTAIGPSS